MTPTQVGRYRILGLLGRGGMGQVYHAHDPDLDREFVVKFVAWPEASFSPKWRERFKREVQAAARLNHPDIVTIYFGQERSLIAANEIESGS